MQDPTTLNMLIGSLVIVGFTALWIGLGLVVHRLSFHEWNHRAQDAR
jgi:hypothetical protein